jgi:uncharacterized protein (DUF302 family)
MRTLIRLILTTALTAAPAAHAQQANQPQPAYPFSLPALPLPNLPAAIGSANPWMQNSQPAFGGWSFIPFMMPMKPPEGPRKPYTFRPTISQQAKKQMMQMMMPMMTNVMRMSMPDAMNWAAHKIKAKPGLSFDDVRDSLFLRANQVNFKKVGENLMWKDFHVVLNDMEAPRIEVYSFCDIAVGRDLLKISPEFLVFLPCRIAIMEDADKNIWVMMLDWNMDWVAGYESQLAISPELLTGARDLRQRMEEIMQAAANGDL